MASAFIVDRRLHGNKGEKLHHVVLHDVAKHACLFPKFAPCADAYIFADGNLHMVDMVVVPDRFKDRIAKAKDKQILYRFFAKPVVDAVDLLFFEILLKSLVASS